MINENIRKYMDNKGIKQTFISSRTGMNRTAVSMALSGKRNLKVEEYTKICDALSVPYATFID